MAVIVVNNEMTLNGHLTVQRELIQEEDKNGDITEKMINTGVFSTHCYIEDIRELETNNIKIKGVKVLKEHFGSDDYETIYEFVAEEIENKGVVYEDNYHFDLLPEEMELIEKELYKNNDEVLGQFTDNEKLYKELQYLRKSLYKENETEKDNKGDE